MRTLLTLLLGLATGCSLILSERDDGPDDPSECTIDSCEPFVIASDIGANGDFTSIQSWIDNRAGDLPRRHKIEIAGLDSAIAEGQYTSDCFSGMLDVAVDSGATELVLSDVERADGDCAPPFTLTSAAGDTEVTYVGHLGVGAIEEGQLTSTVYVERPIFGGGSTQTSERAFFRLRNAPANHHRGSPSNGALLSPGPGATNVITVDYSFTQIVGIEIANFSAEQDGDSVAAIRINADNVLVNELLIHAAEGPGRTKGIDTRGEDTIVANSAFDRLEGQAVVTGDNTASAIVVNCTAIRCFSSGANGDPPHACFHALSPGTMTAYNTIGLADTLDIDGFAGISAESTRNLILAGENHLGSEPIEADSVAEVLLVSTLQLASGSPAVRAGLDLSAGIGPDSTVVSRTIETNRRPEDDDWDLGAF